MTKELWINLPVKDVKRSRNFFTAIGFSFKNSPGGNTETSAALVVGSKGIIVMLFEEKQIRHFMQNELTDTSTSNEVMLSFDAESPEEVDEVARKVEAAGGVVFAQPADIQGWMYGCAFTDPDGHRWNSLYMNPEKMPK
ncbi:extradiol dioxygenase [Mucilaginibacter pallidiroseus]|uniref:Extradiol dioxygenase n=1 Tax=Mucilaginibacter pallidiroseus TaxID=2599295 RepID=A0A563UGW5_9SPHI|nr:VOC family protein [Mucilaginibacter pallidiroseus]TWR30604.1 extradiol dioxygenase [Mucilaginibacter pallidiroseus]